MMNEVNKLYANAFREADWVVRLQFLYLLAVPFVLAGLSIYLSTKW